LYVTGSPGTGKTLVVQHTLNVLTTNAKSDRPEPFRDIVPPRIAFVNVMGALKDRGALFAHLLSLFSEDELTHEERRAVELGISTATSRNDMSRFFNLVLDHKSLDEEEAGTASEGSMQRANGSLSSARLTIVALDEADALEKSVLVQLFQAAKRPRSQLVLICIANAVDLIERALPELITRGFAPQTLVFSRYTLPALRDILRQRWVGAASSLGLDDDITAVVDTAAIELCVRHVANRAGDVRVCLDLCRQAIRRAMQTKRILHFASSTNLPLESKECADSGRTMDEECVLGKKRGAPNSELRSGQQQTTCEQEKRVRLSKEEATHGITQPLVDQSLMQQIIKDSLKSATVPLIASLGKFQQATLTGLFVLLLSVCRRQSGNDTKAASASMAGDMNGWADISLSATGLPFADERALANLSLRAMERLSLPLVPANEFSDILMALASAGLISISKSGGAGGATGSSGRQQELRVLVHSSDLLAGLESNEVCLRVVRQALGLNTDSTD